MATRKRVRAFGHSSRLHRTPDGSAFTKCEDCGVTVAIALMDMHDCNVKKQVKKFKRNFKPLNYSLNSIPDQPRSPFMFFMESYAKSCEKGRAMIEISSEAFEKWKKMSYEERRPYIVESRKVENAYMEVIHQEEIQLSQEGDDGAESAKCYENYYEDEDDSEESEGWNNFRCLLHQNCFGVEIMRGNVLR